MAANLPSSSRHGRRRAPMSEINVTSLVDVMLVLLIIFMIVTPLIAAGFKATLPKGANLDKDPEGTEEVVVGIDASGISPRLIVLHKTVEGIFAETVDYADLPMPSNPA